MDTELEYINKQYTNLSMVQFELSVGYTIKHDLAKITLHIYQPHLIKKMTQVFNNNVK